MHRGFIALWRKFRDWEWYGDPVVKDVFIELLLTANHKPSRYKGYDVPRGAVVTGRNELAKTLGFTPKQIRRALDSLENGGELGRKRASKFSVITILKYDDYQDDKKKKGQQMGQQRASKGPHLKNEDNVKKEYSDQFLQFWEQYPRKIGKKKASEAFDKAGCGNGIFDDVMSGAKAYADHCSSENTSQRYIAHPTTWINQERWTDEYSTNSNSSGDEYFDPFAAAKRGATQ